MFRLGWHVFIWVVMLALAPQTLAVTWDDATPPPPGDPDYAAGIEAFRRENWKEVVQRMLRVVKQRPWNDEAHNRLGFAFRKLGDYTKALDHYGKALELNPYNRGALEYLGEAYIEMGRLPKAREMLRRLEAVCRRVVPTGSKDGWKSECEEWRELNQAIRDYVN